MHDAHHCKPLLFHCFQDHHNCQNSKLCGEMRPNTMGTRIDFSNLWGRWVNDHPQEDLAKFGYRSERKVEMFRNYVIFWWYARIYCPNMAISEIKSNSCNVELWAIFFQNNPSYLSHWVVFWSPRCQKQKHWLMGALHATTWPRLNPTQLIWLSEVKVFWWIFGRK